MDKTCATCKHFFHSVTDDADYCLATVRKPDRVTGRHQYWKCADVRQRKPRWPSYDGMWCGWAGRLWVHKDDSLTKDRQHKIAEILMKKAGFNEDDAFDLAKEIMETT